MPRKKKSNGSSETPTAAEPKIPKELLDQLITGPITQSEFESIYRALKKAIIERAMSAEMTEHLGYKHGEPKPLGQPNQRNGSSGKTVLTDDGPVDIEVPRDREGSYEPLIIGKHERRFMGFDQKIIAMYARGMTVREIQGYLAEMYGTDVSPNRGHFPSDEAAIKLLWLALRNINDGKVRSAREWKMAMNQFAVLYGDRFVSHAS